MKTVILCTGCFLLMFCVGGCTKKDNKPSYGTIYGIVYDNETKEPINGVNVSIDGGEKKFTSIDGRYEFSDLDAQQYRILAQNSGYKTNYASVNLLVGETKQVDIPLTKN